MLKINELVESAAMIDDSEETLTLAGLAFNQKAIVSSVNGDNSEVLCRLLTLGIYPGVHIEVLRRAPLGDPLQIRSGTTLMSIRNIEANGINVELIK